MSEQKWCPACGKPENVRGYRWFNNPRGPGYQTFRCPDPCHDPFERDDERAEPRQSSTPETGKR